MATLDLRQVRETRPPRAVATDDWEQRTAHGRKALPYDTLTRTRSKFLELSRHRSNVRIIDNSDSAERAVSEILACIYSQANCALTCRPDPCRAPERSR